MLETNLGGLGRLRLHPARAPLAPASMGEPSRGVLILTGGASGRMGMDRDRFELVWPATCAVVASTLESLRVTQEAARQTWLDHSQDVHGFNPYAALTAPVRCLLWYFEFDALKRLGFDANGTVPSSDSEAWNQFLDDAAESVPPTTVWLDRAVQEAARQLMFTVLIAEEAGHTQGKCFLRIRSNQSARAGDIGGSLVTHKSELTS